MTHRHAAPTIEPALDLPVVALVGRPNVGKSTFLARGSGHFAETANAPGTTVRIERRRVCAEGREAILVDLPGTRSLLDRPAGDAPFWEHLEAARPDAILVLVDAGDLARHLPLALACRDLGLPIVVAANLADDAARHGIEIDTGRLSQLLCAPVHLTNGRAGEGVAAALADAIRLATRRRDVRLGVLAPSSTVPAPVYAPSLEGRVQVSASELARQFRDVRSVGAAVLDATGFGRLIEAGVASPRGAATIALGTDLDAARADIARGWVGQVERQRAVRPPFRDRLERLATEPWPGIPAFIAVTLLTFGAMVVIGGWLAALLGTAWTATVSPAMTAVVTALVPIPTLATALLWALDGGLLALISVGIPYILTFYVLLAILEDSGYLTSAAVLLDRIFNALGLPGRAAVPLLAAAGCNVPALYGTRILQTRRERILASMLITLTPCSARSAVVIAALTPLAGPGVALAAFGVTAAVAIGAGVAANAMVPGRQPSLVLEMAHLRVPVPAHVGQKAWARFRGFVVTAAPIMLVGSFVVGLAWESGAWAPFSALLGPVTQGWLGLPPIAGVAIAFGFLRKELALQLLIALAIVEYGLAAGDLGSFMSAGQVFVFAIVTSISIPCAATLAALAEELGRRPALAITLGSLALALVTGGVLARLLGIA
ncbi:MAG TPA: ferrous iron transporter B [Candidatus Limnocylindrales bacterium]|nr:ferrous iron transporter B [Candidatus Limnocylindrales bacterium]